MPGTPTQLTAVNAEFTNTVVTPSVSPTASALLLIVVTSNSGGNHKVSSVSHTFGMRADGQGRTFKRLYNTRSDPDTNADATGFGADFCTPQIFWGVTSATPGSGTVTVNINAGIVGFKVRIIQVTDVDLYMPIRQWHFDGTASSLAAFTSNLPFTPLSSNMLLSISHGREATTTVGPDTGWTELSEDTTASAPSNIQYRTGTTSTQFGVSFGTTLTDGITVGAIEIRGPVTNALPDPTQLRRYEHLSSSVSALTVPTTGSVSVNNGDLILVPVIMTVSGGVVVTSVTSTFAVSGSWQFAVGGQASGTSHTRVEWWWAIASATGSGTVTVNFSNGNFGTRGAWILSLPAGTFNQATPIAQSNAALANSLTAPNHLTGSFTGAPAAPSTLVAVGLGTPNSTQIFVQPRVGWFYVGPPISEGGSQTSYVIYSREWQTFGGRFGLTPGSHDSTGGAAWAALEIQAAAGDVSGTLSETLAGATLAASGELEFEGSLAETLAGASLSASGELEFEGALAETLEGVTLAASGTTGIDGSLSETLDGVTLSSTGELEFEGSLSETLDGVTLAASGAIVDIQGSLSETLDGATLSASGELSFTGALSETLDGVVPTISGSVRSAVPQAGSAPPGQFITFDLLGFSSAPTGATFNGVATTIQNATTSSVEVLVPALSTYALGQPHAATQWNVAQEVAISEPAGTALASVQVAPPDTDGPTYWFGNAGATPYPEDSLFPVGTAENDDYFFEVTAGSFVSFSNLGVAEPDTLPAQGQVRMFDESAGSWTSIETHDFQLELTGTLAETLDGVTLAGAGELEFEGSLAEALAGVILVASGDVQDGFSGTLGVTLAGASLAAAGETIFEGALNETLDGATGVISGAVADTVGSLNEVLEGVSLSASGEVEYEASVAITLPGAVLSALAEEEFEAALSVTLDGVTSTAQGQVVFEGSLAEQLAGVTLAADGVVAAFIGSLSVVLDGVTIAAEGAVQIFGSLSEILEGAVLTGTGTVLQDITGSLSVTLAGVTLSSAGINVTGSTSQNIRITIDLASQYNSDQVVSILGSLNSSQVVNG